MTFAVLAFARVAALLRLTAITVAFLVALASTVLLAFRAVARAFITTVACIVTHLLFGLFYLL